MKRKDFRLGNWVRTVDEKISCQVTRLSENGFYVSIYKGYNNSIEVFEGIPITTEMLLKAGFEKEVYRAFTLIDKWVGDDGFCLRLKLESGKTEFFLVGNGGHDESGEMNITSTCKYVHQLQNLYFSLTGEELEIIL